MLDITGDGEFSQSKLVIPAKAGIKNCFGDKTGCPPKPVPAKAVTDMTGKLPEP